MRFHPVFSHATPTIRHFTGAGASLLLVAGAVATVSAASPPPSSVPAPYGVARNGSFAFAEGDDIWVADADGANKVVVITGPARDSGPSFSRDGTRIAFRRDEGWQYPKLMVANADGSSIMELADSTDQFDWSPTGDRLLANHDVNGRPSLSIVQADGSGIQTLEPGGIAPTGWAAWRPTGGDEVIFTGHPLSEVSDLGLYAIHPDGTGLRTIGPVSTTESDEQVSFQGPRLSPDGSVVAYSNWEPSDAGIVDGYLHVRDLDSGDDRRVAVRPVAEANVSPRFAPDGTTIVVEAQSETEELAQLVVAPVDGSRPGVVVGPDYSYMQETDFAFSPDGESVVLTLDGVTVIVDVASGEIVRTLEGVTSFPTWQRLATNEAALELATLPPDGSWQVELSGAELSAAGWAPDVTAPGTYTWIFGDGRARIVLEDEAGGFVISCDAAMAPIEDLVRLTYEATGACGGEVDDLRWRLDPEGLHISLVATNAGVEQQQAYLETKPWQAVDTEPIPTAAPWQARCELGCQGPIAAGTFRSVGFLPGLQLTFADDAWFDSADYPDEIEFDRGESVLRFWQTARASSEQGEPLSDVPLTPEGLTEWFVANPDMVVSEPESVTLGDGIAATTFTLRISDTNVNEDPGCPSDVRSCLNVLWINEGHVFAIGYGEAVRLYLFTVPTGGDARTIVVSLDTPSDAQLVAMTADVAPILASLRLSPS